MWKSKGGRELIGLGGQVRYIREKAEKGSQKDFIIGQTRSRGAFGNREGMFLVSSRNMKSRELIPYPTIQNKIIIWRKI